MAHNTVRHILDRPYLVIHAEPTSITQPRIFQWATADETGYGQAWLANPGPEAWSPERRALWQHKLKQLSRMPPVQRFRERTFNELRRRETLVAWNAELTRRALLSTFPGQTVPKMVCLMKLYLCLYPAASQPAATQLEDAAQRLGVRYIPHHAGNDCWATREILISLKGTLP